MCRCAGFFHFAIFHGKLLDYQMVHIVFVELLSVCWPVIFNNKRTGLSDTESASRFPPFWSWPMQTPGDMSGVDAGPVMAVPF